MAASRVPSVRSPAAFSYLALGAEKRDASHFFLEPIVPVSSSIFPSSFLDISLSAILILLLPFLSTLA